jgi:two-component system, OmpR family, sensor histidine kinase KdpD
VASSTLVDPQIPLSDDDVHELHVLIDVEVDRLIRLVTSLLDMTRIDAGVLELRRGSRSVPELVREAVSSIKTSLGDRDIATEFPERLPDVDVDPLLISQVLANLLDNANRHAPSESVITVAGEVRGDRVALSVTDEGPGIPAEEREVVFDRFVRFDTGGRTGLGLTIAKTFVEAHGERIWVEDAEGEGSRFVFTLPTAATNGAGANGVGAAHG